MITRDLTERKRAEEELLKASKLESLGILAAGIAHDFNNILTTIVSNLYLAKESLSPDDTRFKRLSEAERGIHRAQGLTQQLLTFSKGGAPIRRPADLSELLRVSATFAVQGSNCRCEFALSSNLWTVEIDEGQIGQVIHNLVINAQQAMPDGGSILIRAQNTTVNAENHLPVPDGRYVLISVKDRGVGISEENLPKVFDPFFTTKPKGSGLGLSTSYDIVRRGIGRVLLMDDEAPLRDAIGQILGGLGYSVTLSADGAEAIDLYRKAADSGHPFDAVMLDLTVPGGMGGKEASHRLQRILR
jgi:signal transduction histidine kinase